MWIVGGKLDYYPWIEEYETYEEAKAIYDEKEAYVETVYLAEVKEHKRDTPTEDKE
jgi:hypothetical protein